jgi:hypothetical protein
MIMATKNVFNGISGLHCCKSREISSLPNNRLSASYPPQQSSEHEVDEVVDVDNIFDVTIVNHDTTVMELHSLEMVYVKIAFVCSSILKNQA